MERVWEINDLKINPDTINSIALILLDSKHYSAIADQFIYASKIETHLPTSGEATGYSAFISSFFIQDMSVFTYEFLTFLKKNNVCINGLLDKCESGFYERLRTIRYNIHLYNKYGSYRQKSNSIISTELKSFGLEKRSLLKPLRKDISLVFRIDPGKEKLLGTNYSSKHIFEENSKTWSRQQRKNYACEIAKIVSEIPDYFKGILRLNDCVPTNGIVVFRPMQIELFDFKSYILFSKTSVSEPVAFRLLLVLTSLSYTTSFFDMHIDSHELKKDTGWLCFLTKWLAIKYDEVFDSIENLLKYINNDDNILITSELCDNGIIMTNLTYRSVARNLRNMIHYSDNDNPPKKNEDGSLVWDVFNLYKVKTGLSSSMEFVCVLQGMQLELKKLENSIRSIFSDAEKKILKRQ